MAIKAFFFNLISPSSISAGYVIAGGYTGNQVADPASFIVRITSGGTTKDLPCSFNNTLKSFKAAVNFTTNYANSTVVAVIDGSPCPESSVINVTFNPAGGVPVKMTPDELTAIVDPQNIPVPIPSLKNKAEQVIIDPLPSTLSNQFSPFGTYSMCPNPAGLTIKSYIRILTFDPNGNPYIIDHPGAGVGGLPLAFGVAPNWTVANAGGKHDLTGYTGNYCSHVIKVFFNNSVYCHTHSDTHAILKIS